MIMWIASYPKSGNTWLRALLTSYFYSEDGNFDFKLLPKIYQFPAKKFFTEYEKKFNKITDTAEFWLDAQKKINLGRNFRIFKTHNAFLDVNNFRFTDTNNTSGCIYVVRDPRNVITSIKNHYEHNYEEALKFMLNDKGLLHERENNQFVNFQFLSSWSNHYKSWIDNKHFPIKIVKYEELENNTMQVLEEVITFINSTAKFKNIFNFQKASKCIESTNFDILKKKEMELGFNEAPLGQKTKKKITFFNLGKKNNWKKLIPKEMLDKINNIFKEDLKRLGYN